MTRFLPVLTRAAAVAGCRTSQVSAPTTAPAAAPVAAIDAERVHRREIPQAISEGIAFLVTAQNPDGSWGTGTVTRGNERRNHLAVEKAPRRLAVQKKHGRRVARAFVHVVHAKLAAAVAGRDVSVVSLERVARKVREAVVGSAKAIHGARLGRRPRRGKRRRLAR